MVDLYPFIWMLGHAQLHFKKQFQFSRNFISTFNGIDFQPYQFIANRQLFTLEPPHGKNKFRALKSSNKNQLKQNNQLES